MLSFEKFKKIQVSGVIFMASVEEVQDYELHREQQRIDFVNSSKWAGATISPISWDVSIRRFYRLSKNEDTAVLMDARPPLENTEMYQFMRDKMANIGLYVPVIYEADHEKGFVIMQDFGDVKAYDLVNAGKTNLHDMYSSFIDVLSHKHKADKNLALQDSVAYSDEYWLFRVEQFLIHYMPRVLNREVTQTMREEFLGIYKEALDNAHVLENVLLHGDFGVNNLYYFPENKCLSKVGVIDFQDLTDARGNMMGSPAFDLAFLMEDVRVELPANLEDDMIDLFLKKTGIEDIENFYKEYSTIATAQATKCLGLFARLGLVNGRTEYLKFIPFCLRNLKKNLPNKDLVRVKKWFEQNKINLD